MTRRCLASSELVAIDYRSRFLRVPFERAVVDHRQLMAERRRRPVIVWSGAMRDLSPITQEHMDPATVDTIDGAR